MRHAKAARAIARDLARLFPDWRNPERYFENRDELRQRLQSLARELDSAHD